MIVPWIQLFLNALLDVWIVNWKLITVPSVQKDRIEVSCLLDVPVIEGTMMRMVYRKTVRNVLIFVLVGNFY